MRQVINRKLVDKKVFLDLSLLVLILAASAAPTLAQIETPRYTADAIDIYSDYFQDMYYIQPHNTYDYGPTLTGWLNAGFRSVELDVIEGPVWGLIWQLDPNGPFVAHGGSSGEQNNCSSGSANDRLGHCLQDLLNWVQANPNSEPLLVLVDMKGGIGGGTWTGSEVAALDDFIQSFLGSAMYSFEDLYFDHLLPLGRGGFPRALAAAHGWPRLSALQGKIIVALTGGQIGDVNQGMQDGLIELYSSYGRYPSTFLCPDVESDPEELDVGGKLDGISTNNSQFFLCSNLKSRDHYQITANRAAKNNQIIHLWGDHVYGNTSFTYNYLAVAHGIQVVGQDLAQPASGTTWGGSIPYVGVRRSLPGYFKLRPTDNTNLCMDVEGASYGNGSDLNQWTCHNGSNQRFVYTAEGQLRPRGHNKYCVDISGGDAGWYDDMHLWDCDGGASEKWQITPEGRFRSHENTSYCMSSSFSTASGAQFETQGCGGWAAQYFWLEAVPDWNQTSF